MVQFPPPATSSAADSGEPGYTPAPDRPSFVFPPPRQSSSLSPTEAGMVIGEQMREQGLQAEQALEQAQNLGLVLTDYGDALEEFGRDRVMPFAVPTVAPLSQTVNRWADSSYQVGNMLVASTYANAPNVVGDWDHTTQRHFVFITPAVTRAYSRINFLFSALMSGTAPVWEFAIYVMDEDGVMDRIYGPHRFTDEISVQSQMASISLDSPVVVDQGSYVAVGFRKVSGGERYPLGLIRMEYPLPADVLPPGLSAQMDGGGALPSVVNARTQLDFDIERFVPYVELSEGKGVSLRSIAELWPDVGEAQRPWVSLTSPGIRSSGGYTAPGGTGNRVSVYDTPLATDRVQVETSVYRLFSTNLYRSTLIVRGTGDLRSGVGLSVINHDAILGGGRYELIQWSNVAVTSDWGSRTLIRTINQRPQEGDQIEVAYIDGLVDVRINGVPVVTAEPVASPAGRSNRFVGIQSYRRQDWLFGGFPSPWFGPLFARDLTPEGGDEDDESDGEGQAFQLPPGGATQ